MTFLRWVFQTLLPCRFQEPLCVENPFGCRCGKGKSKDTTTTDQGSKSTSTVTATPTAEEQRLNALQMEMASATQSGSIAAQTAGLDLVKRLLSGTDLPGFYQGLEKGIGEEVTGGIVQQSLKDIAPQFQQGGLLNSGVRAAISARVSADIRNQAAQYNLTNLSNLMNLGIGGSAQIQAPLQGYTAQLSNRLAGIRSVSTTGSANSWGTTTTLGMNPFLKSFQTQLGEGLGKFPFQSMKGAFPSPSSGTSLDASTAMLAAA